MSIRAGQLIERVTLRSLTQTPDGLGGYTQTWSDVATVWGQFLRVRGGQIMDGGQPASASRAEVLIRVRSDVTPTMRAVIRGVTYEVKSAVPRDRDALILDIEEVRL